MIPEPSASWQPSRGAGVDAASFRHAMARFPTGITVVTTTVHGVDHAMTANSFTSVSLHPPMVLVCVEKVTRFYEAVLGAGHWAATVLSDDDRDTAVWFSSRGRPLEGQLDRVPHARGLRTGVPVLTRGLAVVECSTNAVHDGGDHVIVVGDVVGVSTPRPDAGPLVYFTSRYHGLPGVP